jgi:phage recombination protein Bet
MSEMKEVSISVPTASNSVVVAMAERFGMVPSAFEATLRATVCKGNVTREEFAAFLLVAKEYHLNPLTKQIYAFPAKGGGIQPIVSIDGWAQIVNDHPAFDGMEFEDVLQDGKLISVTCKMHRKDRSHPICATEYLAECSMNTDPWKKWPSRMLRHKAMIQTARYAFGFGGIVDPDEYERMVDITPKSNTSLKDRLTARLSIAEEGFSAVSGGSIDIAASEAFDLNEAEFAEIQAQEEEPPPSVAQPTPEVDPESTGDLSFQVFDDAYLRSWAEAMMKSLRSYHSAKELKDMWGDGDVIERYDQLKNSALVNVARDLHGAVLARIKEVSK